VIPFSPLRKKVRMRGIIALFPLTLFPSPRGRGKMKNGGGRMINGVIRHIAMSCDYRA
jgi:hypothetical protein